MRDVDMMLWQQRAGARYMHYVLSLAWLLELTPPRLPPSLSLSLRLNLSLRLELEKCGS